MPVVIIVIVNDDGSHRAREAGGNGGRVGGVARVVARSDGLLDVVWGSRHCLNGCSYC